MAAEYWVISLADVSIAPTARNLQGFLNAQSEQGWDVVSVTAVASGDFQVVFRKTKP
jgi:hypothetical protein